MRLDILKSNDDYVVIPVNLVGVAGAGLAKQWADKYPELVAEYKQWCANYTSSPQQLKIDNKFIMLPTKKHWRDKSDLLNIKYQLSYMYTYMIPHYQNKSVSVPLLGAGLGGLEGKTVKNLLTRMGKGAEMLWDIETDVYG